MNGSASPRPCCGSHEDGDELGDLGLGTADQQAGQRGEPERLEPADQRGGQGRHDEQRVRGRIEAGDGGDQDTGHARQDRGDHPVLARDAVGGDTGQRRPAVVLGARPRGQAKPGETVGERERDRDDDDDAGEVQTVLGERDPGDRQRGTGKDRVGGDRLGAVVENRDRFQGEHHADRRADARQRRGPPERPVDDEVQHEPEDRRVHQRDDDGERRAEPLATVQRDLMRDQDDRQLELPKAAEIDEDVGDEHRHRTVREVDHASTAVLEDEPLAEDGVGGARAEAEDQEQAVAGHGLSFSSRWYTRCGEGSARPEAGGPDR
jgi:hypothetical protein